MGARKNTIFPETADEDLKDVSKLQEKLDELEIEIKEERKSIEAEIVEISVLKEKVDSITLT